jgi:hypothetical protein
MRCVAITPFATGRAEDVCVEVRLMAVYDDGVEENKSWSKYTPNGNLSMTITNQAAIDAFELGKSYFVDFTPAG